MMKRGFRPGYVHSRKGISNSSAQNYSAGLNAGDGAVSFPSTTGLALIIIVSNLVSGLAVAYLNRDSNSSAIEKDYVALAVNIVNSKESGKETRAWAVQILDKLAPVKFTEESAQSLESGGSLFPAPLPQEIYGPKNPLIKKTDKLIQPCPYVNIPGDSSKPLTKKQISQFVEKITEAYAQCQVRQSYAAEIIDILQGTAKTTEAVRPRSYSKIKRQETLSINMGPDES